MTTPTSSPSTNPSKTKVLQKLQHDFEALRKRKTRYQRIPQVLRNAVLAALDDGISPSKVRTACGVTSAQLEQWGSKRHARQKDPHPSESNGDVRILRVIEDPDLRSTTLFDGNSRLNEQEQ